MMSLTRKTKHKSEQQNKSVRLCVEFYLKRETSFTGTDNFMTFSIRGTEHYYLTVCVVINTTVYTCILHVSN